MFGFYGPPATKRTPLPTGESEAARADRLRYMAAKAAK
tara:strand:- start:253 stop:366 length:114 start_codon:yes stop_codon:yes gene_type:complete